jgi:NTP pyrophosphatase (non-canonical NTP hydrolase)
VMMFRSDVELMQRHTVLHLIYKEVSRARKLHPDWPSDPIHAAAIVSEEAGELVRACNDLDMTSSLDEAVHVAATAIRFLEGQ